MIKKIVLTDKCGNKIVPTRVSLAEKINEIIDAAAKGELQPSKYECNSKKFIEDVSDCDMRDPFDRPSDNRIHKKPIDNDGDDKIIDIEDGPFLIIDQKKVVGDGDEAELGALLYVACEDMLKDKIITKQHLRVVLDMIKNKLTHEE